MAMDRVAGNVEAGPVEDAKQIRPGVYGAKGDPWIYRVGADGTIQAKLGDDEWITVRGGKAMEAITDQLASGQLQQIESAADPGAGEAEGQEAVMADPTAADQDPLDAATEIRARAVKKAMSGQHGPGELPEGKASRSSFWYP